MTFWKTTWAFVLAQFIAAGIAVSGLFMLRGIEATNSLLQSNPFSPFPPV